MNRNHSWRQGELCEVAVAENPAFSWFLSSYKVETLPLMTQGKAWLILRGGQERILASSRKRRWFRSFTFTNHQNYSRHLTHFALLCLFKIIILLTANFLLKRKSWQCNWESRWKRTSLPVMVEDITNTECKRIVAWSKPGPWGWHVSVYWVSTLTSCRGCYGPHPMEELRGEWGHVSPSSEVQKPMWPILVGTSELPQRVKPTKKRSGFSASLGGPYASTSVTFHLLPIKRSTNNFTISNKFAFNEVAEIGRRHWINSIPVEPVECHLSATPVHQSSSFQWLLENPKSP